MSPDGDLAARDRALPLLGTALDSSAIAEVVAASRPELGIAAAVATYIRYKPFTNAIVSYRFTTANGPLLGYAKTVRQGDEPKIAKMVAAGGAGVNGALAVNLFPTDRELRALRNLNGSPARLLERLIPAAGPGAQLRTLRYKPERRYVAAVETDGHSSVVIRAHTDADYVWARRAAVAFTSNERFTVAGMTAKSDRNRALALQWMPGSPLSYSLADAPVGAVGEALRKLHGTTPRARMRGDGRRRAERSLLETSALTGWLLPDRAEELDRLTARLVGLIRRSAPQPVPTHGDFSADQVLVDGSDDRIGIIDWDRAAIGDAGWDLGCFLADLECRAVIGTVDRATVDRCRSSLLEGYGDGPVTNNGPLLTAAALVARCAEPFRSRRPSWDDEMRAIVDRVAQLAP
ncbi:MAG: aminoglycoside phosphotransferase family protein [Actinomycetota bacterium]|nr:aminoglycoside phosphotransferase family protein [Actinomycetota bacterium]